MDWHSIRLDRMQSSAYCTPKVVRLKTGEVLGQKAYMSPRLPPKISLRHEWTKELGSKVVQQSTQLTPNPIRDRSGRPDEMQDERKTSRSQEISVNSFNEELSSSVRTRRPVETEVIQTRSSEESKSLNVEHTHDRTGRLGKDTVAIQGDPQVYHEAETLNIDDETLRERIEADMDFRIPRMPHSVVKHAKSNSVRQLIQKIENHPNRHALQQDLRQNQSFNPFSPESKQMIRDVENIELCELLETELKTQCKVCLSYWDIGIVYCTCGHFLRKERGANHKNHPSIIRWTFFQSMSTSSRKDDLTHKWKKKFFQDIHDRFVRGRNEDVCRHWDALANEDHTHHLTPQEYYHHKSNWWQVPILCQCSTDLTLNKHCPPCSSWNRKELKEINIWRRVLLFLHGGVGKVLGALLIPMKVTMEMNQVLIEQGDLFYKYLETILEDMIFLNLLCYRWIVYSWRRSTVTDGGRNTTPQMTCFRRARVCTKWLTGKSDDELVQSDNMRIGTRIGKFKLWIEHDCLVTQRDADTNDNTYDCLVLHDTDTTDNIHHCVALHDANTNDHFHWHPHKRSAHSLVCCAVSHHLHTQRGSSVWVLSCHLHSHVHVSVSPHLDSPFLFLALLHVPYLLPPVPEVRGKPAHSAKREYGLHRRVLTLHSNRLGV